jgi:hypothetical protein
MPRFVDGDEGGGAEPDPIDTLFPEAAPVEDGKAEEAPVIDASAEEDKGKGEEGKETADPSKEQEAAASDDELLAESTSEESADAKSERLERDLGASSKEARRLSVKDKAYTKALEAQGLKVSEVDGEIQFVPTDKYSDKAVITEVLIKDLPATAVDAFESGELDQIQPELDKLLKKQADSLVRAQPTLEKEPTTISPEKKASVFEHMKSAANVDDSPKHEKFELNQKFIEKVIQEKKLDALFAENPEFVSELLNDYTNKLRSAVSAKNKAAKDATDKKEKGAVADSELGVDGSGKPRAAKTGDAAKLDAMFGAEKKI